MPKPVCCAALLLLLVLDFEARAQAPGTGSEAAPPAPSPAPVPPAPAPAPAAPELPAPAPLGPETPTAPAAAAAPAAPAPFSAPAAAPTRAAPQQNASLAAEADASVDDLEWSSRPQRTRRSHDAHADRVVLFPTAETHPQGSFFISSYELVLIQLGYALTDDFQMSALFLPPIVRDQPFFFSPTFKLNVVRSDHGNVALLGGFDFVIDDDDGTVLGRLGAAGQLCVDVACDSSVTLNAHGWTELGERQGTIVLLGAGGLFRASELVSLMIEPSYGLLLQDGEVNTPEGFLLSYGVRLSGKQFGFDLTFVRPFVEDISDELILGIPFVVASYRSD
jgi:hypothetical protein